jgi:PAS domain S-box-containing protein
MAGGTIPVGADRAGSGGSHDAAHPATLGLGEIDVRTIIEHTPSPTYVLDAEGRYVAVSPAWCRTTGLSASECIGRRLEEIWSGENLVQIAASWDEVCSTEQPSVVEEHLRVATGGRDFVTVRFPLRDRTGTVVGYCGMATDVTELRRAERKLAEREQLLEAVVRCSPDVVTVLDVDGRVRSTSDAAWAVLGYSMAGASDVEARSLVHPDDLPAAEAAVRAVIKGTSPSGEARFRVRNATGTWVTLAAKVAPLRGAQGEALGAVVVSRDITHQLEIERRLREARAAARSASDAKTAFVSRLSHELRQVLNVALGFAQLLVADGLPESQREAVEQMRKAAHHALQLVDDALDVARIEAGHLDLYPEAVSLASVMSEAVRLSEPLAADAGVLIDARHMPDASEVLVEVDFRRVQQVMLNLLSNAVKYNRRGGSVLVTWRVVDGRTARIFVEDTGVGIDGAQLETIFEPFERLGAGRSRVEGVGMGLAVARQLVEHMGGSIGVRSVPHAGSTFFVDLPLAEVRQDAVDPPTPRRALLGRPVVGRNRRRSRRGGAVMVRDRADSPGTLRVLCAGRDHRVLVALERAGADVSAAWFGETALELAASHGFDVICVAHGLPGLGSGELIRRLKVGPATRDVPLVVVVPPDGGVGDFTVPGAVYLAEPVSADSARQALDQIARSRPAQ